MLSKTNEDDIRQAISLLEGVLQRAVVDEQDEQDGDDPEANAEPAEEPKDSNARAKALLDRINNERKEM